MNAVHYTSTPRGDVYVMREQFDFLLKHWHDQRGGIHCGPGCLECARYHELTLTLLWPFRQRGAAFMYGMKARHA